MKKFIKEDIAILFTTFISILVFVLVFWFQNSINKEQYKIHEELYNSEINGINEKFNELLKYTKEFETMKYDTLVYYEINEDCKGNTMEYLTEDDDYNLKLELISNYEEDINHRINMIKNNRNIKYHKKELNDINKNLSEYLQLKDESYDFYYKNYNNLNRLYIYYTDTINKLTILSKFE